MMERKRIADVARAECISTVGHFLILALTTDAKWSVISNISIFIHYMIFLKLFISFNLSRLCLATGTTSSNNNVAATATADVLIRENVAVGREFMYEYICL